MRSWITPIDDGSPERVTNHERPVRERFMKRRRWWQGLTALGCVLAGVLLGLGGYTFWYAEGASYFSSNPKACVNCHAMREHFDSWQRASHHAVATCIDCHLPHAIVPKYIAKAENGFWHSLRFTLQDYPEPIRIGAKNARILQQSCIHC